MIPEVLSRWSHWVPLAGAGRDKRLPRDPGLYRVRRVGTGGIDYIGQTGASLRGRLGMLGGIYKPEMPYRDPHTAAPALWALRHGSGCDFEASVIPAPGSVIERKALEAVAITLYRLEAGQSPTANFGRIPSGYRSSTGNNARLVAAGGRARGGPDSEVVPVAGSVPVAGDLSVDPQAGDWMGWPWSTWQSARDGRRSAVGRGLYRVRRTQGGSDELVYVGQGIIAARLRSHLDKGLTAARQAEYFSGDLEASWVELPDTPTVNLLEHENDIIAAHVLVTGGAPAAQFLG